MATTDLRSWVSQSVSLKIFVVGIIALFLLIPAAMIRSLVQERQLSSEEVVKEISSKWGNEQTIAGPIISVPYNCKTEVNGKIVISRQYAHFLPEQLNITGKMVPEIRYRGIYKVIVYTADLQIAGKFKHPDFSAWKVDPSDIIWDEAYVSIGIPDMRGIKNDLRIKFNGVNYEVTPGMDSQDILKQGVSARISLDTSSEYTYSITLKLKGSSALSFVPMGKISKVEMQSAWATPKFDGAFLPDNREVNAKGFRADWTVLHLNRNFPQKWTGSSYNVYESAFGVNLMFPVDHYQKSERAAKYALMFIALTFMVFLFSEILNRRKIHPVQYILVGLALCVFYTLLISLSEQLGFTVAYTLASIGTISLIGSYAFAIFKNKKQSFVLVGVLVTLYIFLFTILQLEDYALIMGSIGLFVALAVVMRISRQVDWYSPLNGGAGEQSKLE